MTVAAIKQFFSRSPKNPQPAEQQSTQNKVKKAFAVCKWDCLVEAHKLETPSQLQDLSCIEDRFFEYALHRDLFFKKLVVTREQITSTCYANYQAAQRRSLEAHMDLSLVIATSRAEYQPVLKTLLSTLEACLAPSDAEYYALRAFRATSPRGSSPQES